MVLTKAGVWTLAASLSHSCFSFLPLGSDSWDFEKFFWRENRGTVNTTKLIKLSFLQEKKQRERLRDKKHPKMGLHLLSWSFARNFEQFSFFFTPS